METKRHYISILKEHLSLRQKANPHYSLRAFSRDLDIHSSTLSQVLAGKRGLPIKRAIDVAEKLDIGPKEKTLFMESFYRSKTNIDEIRIDDIEERFMLDESYFKVIAEWEHYAVLELFNLKFYDLSPSGISNKMGITENRAEVVIQNLLNCSLIKLDDLGEYSPTHSSVRTTEDVTSVALKKSHKETLEIGIQKLDEIEIEMRDFSSTTVAIDLKKLSEAKTIIREFRQKMSVLLRDGEKTDVYQLAIQFYPLTNLKHSENIQ